MPTSSTCRSTGMLACTLRSSRAAANTGAQSRDTLRDVLMSKAAPTRWAKSSSKSRSTTRRSSRIARACSAACRFTGSFVETTTSARLVAICAACRVSSRDASPMITGMPRRCADFTPRASACRSIATTRTPRSCSCRSTWVPTLPSPTSTMWSRSCPASRPWLSASRAFTMPSTTAAVISGSRVSPATVSTSWAACATAFRWSSTSDAPTAVISVT